jgi:hypothetical protein
MQSATSSWVDANREQDSDTSEYRGQFVLSRARGDLPVGWQSVEAAGWHLATNDVPIHRLVRDDRFLGWCVGHPLGDGPIDLDPSNIDAFYERFAGPWALLLVGLGRVMLDPGAQMAAVYDTEVRIVASTPTLIPSAQPRDLQFEHEVGFPDRDGWFPFGLTSRPNVRRLLPNHMLDLEEWTVTRHWPTPETDLSIHPNVQPLVTAICRDVTNTLRIAREQHPLQITVTAGHDSRMVLACARELMDGTTFFTYSREEETVDMHIARRLANIAQLEHRFIPFIEADEAQKSEWLQRTGHAVCGGILKIHPSMNQLDPERILVTGIGGEIGRSIYYRRGDTAQQTLTADVLLRRVGRPPCARLLEAGAHWLQSLRGFDAFVTLDMLYIENRLACWAAPQRFTNITSKFEFTPFVHRRVIESILHLPHYYRWRDHLPYSVMQQMWPELRRAPVNRFTEGWKGMRDRMIAIVRATAGPVRYRGGEL